MHRCTCSAECAYQHTPIDIGKINETKQAKGIGIYNQLATFTAVSSGPSRAPDCLHYANMLCWLTADVAKAMASVSHAMAYELHGRLEHQQQHLAIHDVDTSKGHQMFITCEVI